MKIVEGVQLHFIKTKQYKSNHITVRFSGDLNQKTVAKRVLVAQMLATANEEYPTTQAFRQKLAQLYGASLSTRVSTKGLVHIVDIDISFVQDKYAFNGESVLDEMIQFLRGILFSPLLSVAQYQPKVFEIEKTNLITYLEADKEDSFYYSSLKAKELFYSDENLQLSKYGTIDLVSKETAYTSYQEFHHMLMEDCIDIYMVGDFEEYRVVQQLHQFPFVDRNKNLNFIYKQDYINVVHDTKELKDINQSILQMGYHFTADFGSKNHYALIILNALLGSFSHSKLFTKIREEEGIAYSIGSRMDIYTGYMDIFAGIDNKDRKKALQLIIKEVNDIKMGRFSSNLIQKTKSMIVNSVNQSQDNCKVLIDRMYIIDYVDSDYQLDIWIDKINKISKRDIVKAANLLKLQALYYLEGK
ncbi:EF-P 5-aminopentanol modification-associated protein YfmF [Streptococcus hongkongensis]|nr:peptidase M16 [Streptococcus uberis]